MINKILPVKRTALQVFWEENSQGTRYSYFREWRITLKIHPFAATLSWEEIQEEPYFNIIKKAYYKALRQ